MLLSGWLVGSLILSCLSNTLQAHLPRAGTARGRLYSPTSIDNQCNLSQTGQLYLNNSSAEAPLSDDLRLCGADSQADQDSL